VHKFPGQAARVALPGSSTYTFLTGGFRPQTAWPQPSVWELSGFLKQIFICTGDTGLIGNGPMKLRLRGTFIDCLEGDGISLSPRASSEPRQSVTRSSMLFECEQNYIEHLASRGTQCRPLPAGLHRKGKSHTPRTYAGSHERKVSSPGYDARPDENHCDLIRPWLCDREATPPPTGDEKDRFCLLRRRSRDRHVRDREVRIRHRGHLSPPQRTPRSPAQAKSEAALCVDGQEKDREDSPCPSLHGEAGSEKNFDSQSEVSSIPPSSMAREFRPDEPKSMDKKSDDLPEQTAAMPVGLVTPSTQAPFMAWDALSVVEDSDRHDRYPKNCFKKARGCSSAASVRSEPAYSCWRDRKPAHDWDARHRRQSAGTSSLGRSCQPRRDPAFRTGSKDPLERQRDFYVGGSSWSECYGREDILKEEVRQKIQKTESTLSCISDGRDSADSHRRVGSETPDRRHAQADQKRNKKEGKVPERVNKENTELRSKMQASAQQISDGWGSERRLSTAMAVFEEIPRRIGDDMQRVASHVVDNVQSEVEFMSKMVRQTASDEFSSGRPIDRKGTEKVVKNLEAIPTMVLNLLEARVEKAKATVRHRINGMIQTLSAIQEEDGEDNNQLVAQMRSISAEVEQIAGEAVEAAAQECYTHKTRQLDFALAALKNPNPDNKEDDLMTTSSEKWPETWETMNQQMGQTVKAYDAELWRPTERGADEGRMANMEQAVAVVQDKDYMPHSVTNQVVADELLRAKVRRGGIQQPGWQSQKSDNAVASNPGSMGHPDLCPRPCLYYASGNCINGNLCGFCHMPHPKRPVRLDKRHREMLKRMPFEELVKFLLPILKQRCLDMSIGSDVCELLDELAEEAYSRAGRVLSEGSVSIGAGAEMSPAAKILFDSILREDTGSKFSSAAGSVHSFASSADGESRSSTSARKKSGFFGALQVMGGRSLLTMLNRMAPTEAIRERELIDKILLMLHDRSDPTDILEDWQQPALWRSATGQSSDRSAHSGSVTPSGAVSAASGLAPPGDWSQVSPSNARSSPLAQLLAAMQSCVQAQAQMPPMRAPRNSI